MSWSATSPPPPAAPKEEEEAKHAEFAETIDARVLRLIHQTSVVIRANNDTIRQMHARIQKAQTLSEINKIKEEFQVVQAHSKQCVEFLKKLYKDTVKHCTCGGKCLDNYEQEIEAMYPIASSPLFNFPSACPP